MQNLSEAELAEMPSCNLAESIHNKWKQQSGDRGSDLYVATVDDFMRAFMQCSTYSQFLKRENIWNWTVQRGIELRWVQKSAAKRRISKPLHEAILKMPSGDEWCTRTPLLKGEEVFVFLKRKIDIAFGDERESHKPDEISILRARVQTSFVRLNDSPPPVITPHPPTTTHEEQPQLPTHDAPQHVDRYHVTTIEETLCNPA